MKTIELEYYLKKEWKKLVRKNKIPSFIPKDPEKYYKKTGEWKSWAHLFGIFNEEMN